MSVCWGAGFLAFSQTSCFCTRSVSTQHRGRRAPWGRTRLDSETRRPGCPQAQWRSGNPPGVRAGVCGAPLGVPRRTHRWEGAFVRTAGRDRTSRGSRYNRPLTNAAWRSGARCAQVGLSQAVLTDFTRNLSVRMLGWSGLTVVMIPAESSSSNGVGTVKTCACGHSEFGVGHLHCLVLVFMHKGKCVQFQKDKKFAVSLTSPRSPSALRLLVRAPLLQRPPLPPAPVGVFPLQGLPRSPRAAPLFLFAGGS